MHAGKYYGLIDGNAAAADAVFLFLTLSQRGRLLLCRGLPATVP